jgi:hypothetical protein
VQLIQPWSRIVEHYERYAEGSLSLRELAVLARLVGNSPPLAHGLFGWTSMHDLCVVQTEVTYPYHGPKLIVSPLATGQIELRYIDTPDKTKHWHRIVDADQAVPQLLKFLDQLRWFPAQTLRAFGLAAEGRPKPAAPPSSS